MSSPLVHRNRTPIVFVAYGEPGMTWLRSLRRRCLANTAIRELVDRRVIQFWCIGEVSLKVDGIHQWSEVPALVIISDILETARSARAMAECPGLTVREILVLERVSMFTRGIADVLDRFWNTIETVPEYVQRDTDGRPGFQYRRIALADTLHDAARVTEDDRADARRAALAIGHAARTFLVDRQDTNVAVIDEDLAERCLAELAMAFVGGDIGAPRSDGVSVVLPEIMTRNDEPSVIPFGVAVVDHAWKDIASARVDTLLQALAAGLRDVSRAEVALGSPSALVDELTADISALDANRFDRHLRRIARERAAQSALGWAFVTGQPRMIRDVIASVKREIPRILARASMSERSVPISASVPALPLLGVLQSWQSLSNRPELIGTGLAMLALIGVGVAWSRRRRTEITRPRDTPADNLPSGLRRDVATEWEQLCERLSGFIDYWEKESRRLRTVQDGVATSAGRWKSNPPIGWRLTNPGKLDGDDVVVTPELCLELGRRIASEWYDDTEYAALVRNACHHEISRWDSQRNTGRSLLGEYLKGSMVLERSRELRAFVEGRPYLTNTSPPPVRDSILWFSAPELGVDEQLRGLESAAVRESATAMSHDDDTCSVRFNFARPVNWIVISSLAFPKADAGK